MAQVAAHPQPVLPEIAQAKPNPESSNLGPNEVTLPCLSAALAGPLLRRNSHDLQPCVQVNADSINDISAYASDQDKFSPGEGLEISQKG